MKKRYKRDAFYLDDGILLHGYKDKRGFHPDKGIPCGFGLQILNKKAIGKELFYKLSDAIKCFGEVKIAGGKIIASIDDGMWDTKIICSYGDIQCWYQTEMLCEQDNIKTLILECIETKGIKSLCEADVIYMRTSDKLKRIIRI